MVNLLNARTERVGHFVSEPFSHNLDLSSSEGRKASSQGGKFKAALQMDGCSSSESGRVNYAKCKC